VTSTSRLGSRGRDQVNQGRLEEPALRRGECDPVSPTDAHAGGEGAADPSLRDRPIDLIDIARALGESSNIERLDGAAIRAWRDELTLIQESLSYARTILAADVAILSQSRSEGTTTGRDVVDELPGRLTSSPGEEQWSAEDLVELEDLEVAFDEGLFARTDQLLRAHREMARVDLSSAAATANALALVEEQLAILTERHAAVDARLQQIRAVIIRRYRQAAAPARDRPA
jgi:hypothetical protein